MQTKIKTKVYAARLRKKLEALEKDRPHLVQAYRADVDLWRKDMVSWLTKGADERVKSIKLSKARTYNGKPHVDTSAFFRGMPEAPKWPSDKQIREIRAVLRHLGITGQETITVSTEDVSRYLGDGDESVEE